MPNHRTHRRARAARLLLAAAVTAVAGTSVVRAAPGSRVDNPFADADLYVDPGYRGNVEREIDRAPEALAAAMREVAQRPTGVWLDSFEALAGSSAEGGGRRRLGLEAHLLDALEQRRDGVPLTILFVVYNLPSRDCAARASNGTLAGEDGLAAYRRDFIDPIARHFADPRFRDLRIVTVIEPDSLPNLVTNLHDAGCAEAATLYAEGVAYALERFAEVPNVYTYLDIGHAGWLGWPEHRTRAIALYRDIAQRSGALDRITGVATNVSGYTPTEEYFLGEPARRFADPGVRSARFYEYNPMLDERRYAEALEAEFEAAGFAPGFGVLIDTSRNGWGGPERPHAAADAERLEDYVEASRLDRRAARGHWCNQRGAGLGAAARAWPYGENGAVDAFFWIKPPGESDGASSAAALADAAADGDAAKGFDSNCDPAGVGDSGLPTGALPDAPPAGHWFSAQFRELVTNAWPRLPSVDGERPATVDAELERTLRARTELVEERRRTP